jgi:hypothetical protein
MSIDEVYELSYVDPWFLDQILQIIELEEELKTAFAASETLSPAIVAQSQRKWFFRCAIR